MKKEKKQACFLGGLAAEDLAVPGEDSVVLAVDFLVVVVQAEGGKNI